jgi:putative Mn2+ efflux pump MntP
MSHLALLILAIGLSMDAFAVSLASGASIRHQQLRHSLRLAVFFGAFQALMPALGWAAGSELRGPLGSAAGWIAGGILAIIGARMFHGALKGEDEESDAAGAPCTTMLVLLAVATSIDAFAAGVSLSLRQVEIGLPVLLIGGVTFAFCLPGALAGARLGCCWGRPAAVIGGIVLVGLGTRLILG